MHMFILDTGEYPDAPADIKVEQNFGYERIRSDTTLTQGDVLLVSGEPEAFRRWLGGHLVWTTNNPMMGDWTQHQVQMPGSSL